MEDTLVRFESSFNVNNKRQPIQNQYLDQNMGSSSNRTILQTKENRKRSTMMMMMMDTNIIRNYKFKLDSKTALSSEVAIKQGSRFEEDTSLCDCNREISSTIRQTSTMPSFSSFNGRRDLPFRSSSSSISLYNSNNNKTAKMTTTAATATKSRRTSVAVVADTAASTITLCHLKLAILILCLLLVQSYMKLCSVNAQQNNQHRHHNNYFHHNDQMLPQRLAPIPETVSITIPAYSPTRTPLNPSHHSNHNSVALPTSAPVSPSAPVSESVSPAAAATASHQHQHQHQHNLQQQQQKQQQVFANRNLDPKPSSSSSKFTRTNELDVFLDDINHSELSAIASGKPINDLFKPKVMPQVEVGQHSSDNGGQSGNSAPGKQEEAARTQLDSSGSEQQIYSECALILQRTYVKNINDPK